MLRHLFCTIIVLAPSCGSVSAQIDVSGQGSVAFVKSENGLSQYVFNRGNPTLAWRWDLFADMRVTDNIELMTNMRMLQDEALHIDFFAVRISNIASTGINAQLGLIDLPFGNLAERRFPKQNPFFKLPLMNDHLTSFCASDYKLWVLSPEFAMRGDGVRLLDQGLYDVGAKLYGTIGIFDYAVAITNGMVSETGTYAPQGLNPNGGFGKFIRLAATPMTGLTFGASYASGPFMNDQSADEYSALFGRDPNEYPQQIVMGDLDFGLGHFTFYGQAAYNVWNFAEDIAEPNGGGSDLLLKTDLIAHAYSAEFRYALTPRLSIAARGGALMFNAIADSVMGATAPVWYSGPWDHNVIRLEGAVGYHFSREFLVKIVYEWNRTYDLLDDPHDNVLAVQTVVSF